MAACSSLTFGTTFPSMDFISFRTSKPCQTTSSLPKNTNLPAILTLHARFVRFRVNAGYTKKPMDAPGAYELIDDDSGERVIVLGDDDDDDFSPLSEQVFSRNRGKKATMKTRENSAGTSNSSAVQRKTSSTTQKLNSGFGRLKAQKIRSVARKISQSKRVTDKHKYKELDIDEIDVDDSIDDDDETPNSDSGPFIRGRRGSTAKSGIEELLDAEVQMKSSNSNASKRSSSRVPIQNSRGGLRDLKPVHKFSSGSDFFSRKFFKDLPCSDFMIDSLKALGFIRPSHIQAMAYAPAVEGKSCIIADQSGSGKTLAYLAPIIQRLRQEEINGTSKSAPKSPRAVVLAPTAELASQVLRNCRSISKSGVPFRSMVATGGFRRKTQLEGLERDLDVIIATPGRFMYLMKEGFLHLENLRCVVLDEVDILFNDEEFEEALQSLITASPVTVQYLFVTATLPVEIYNKLVEVFPDCEVIMGPGMHRTSIGLEEILVDCSGAEGSEKTPETSFLNKKAALLKLAEESPVSKTIVFCNKIETCRKVENSLRRVDKKENQIRVLPFHAALEQETRLANMEEFLNVDTGNKSLFLICTDRASRGIDFPSVDHVVLFDYPRDPSEYVRRVGRTARGAGGKGKAFIFVVGKQVSLARRIIERNLKGHPLHEVPSAYEMIR